MIFCPSEGNDARMVRRKYAIRLPKYGYKYPKDGDLRLPWFILIMHAFPFR